MFFCKEVLLLMIFGDVNIKYITVSGIFLILQMTQLKTKNIK